MSCRGLIAAVATVAAILSGDAGAALANPHSRQEPELAGYDRGVAAAVRSDLAAAGSPTPSATTSPAAPWSGSAPGTSPGPGTSPPSSGRPSPRPDAPGPTQPRPTRPARPRPAPCSCRGPAATMLPARHATCGPSSPTCPSAHPHPGQTARDAGRLLPEIIASRDGPGLKESCLVSHRVGGREVRSMSDLIPAPSADR
jgi:hypothetical protein